MKMKTTRYNLLSADDNLKFRTFNTDNFTSDLTSIINTLENYGNPSRLFINNDPEDINLVPTTNLLQCLLENINNITFWLNRTAYPSVFLLKNPDVYKVIDALSTLCGRIITITKMTKRQLRHKSRCNSSHIYTCNCICNDTFVISNNGKAWNTIQDHGHIEESFCLGQLFSDSDFSDSEEMSFVSDVESISDKSSSNDNDISASDMSFNSADSTNNSGLNNLEVLKVLYPLKLVRKVGNLENNKKFYTIQKISDKRFRCLLCIVELNSENNVCQHVVGSAHTNSMLNPFFVTRVLNYHEIFSQFPVEYFMQAAFFVPHDRKHCLTCKVCLQAIQAVDFKNHIMVHNHKFRLSHKKYANYCFYAKITSSLFFPVNNTSDGSEKELVKAPIHSKLVYNSNYTTTNKNSDEKNDDKPTNTSPTANNSQLKETENDVQINGNGSNLGNEDKSLVKSVNNNVNKSAQTSDKKKSTAQNMVHNIRLALPEKPRSILDGLEKRFEMHKVFIKYFEGKPVCVPCAMPLAENKNAFKTHFITKEHATKSQAPRPIYRYVCDNCPQIIYTEQKWIQHLKSPAHKQRISNSLGALAEHECTTCKYVIFGNETSIKKHKDKPVIPLNKTKAVKEIKLPQRIRTLFQSEQRLLEEVSKFVSESQSVLRQVHLSWSCCTAIQTALQSEFGQCRAYPFGSRISGLGSMMSDLDVFVDTGKMYEGLIDQDADSQAMLVKRTAKILKKHPDFTDITSIPSARTPIVQVYHKVTGLDCDLSFRHGLSVENTAFLRLCIDVQPVLKQLILMLKRWSNSCRLNARISTYALSMLSIFFMQINGYLLSIKNLREVDPTEPKTIGGWRSFCYTKPIQELVARVIPCQIPIRDLLRNFFRYYATFKFDKQVVCPLLGQPILKTDFHEDKGKRLPLEMGIYVERINADKDFEVFRSTAPMCIQDPFDLSHNLTKACTEELIKKFITLCQLSSECLT